MVEPFSGSGNVPRPHNGAFGKVVCQLPTTRKGEIRGLADLGLVGVSDRLRRSLLLQMQVDSYREPLVNLKRYLSYGENVPSSNVTSLCLFTQSSS